MIILDPTQCDRLADEAGMMQNEILQETRVNTVSGRLPELESAWEAVVLNGKEPPEGTVREEVKISWKRCLELGLDPFSTIGPPLLKGDDLQQLQKKNEKLLNAASSTLKIIELSVRDTGYIITLTDREGYVLAVTGGCDIMKRAKSNHYLPGSLRSSDFAGTNAIGLCLDLERPVQLTGAEHYRRSNHSWTCSSSPVTGVDGELLGAITLSGPSSENQPHTLPLIISASQSIEGQLRENNLVSDKVRLNTMLTQILDSLTEGVIALDESLNITHVNSMAACMLDTDTAELLGRSILDFAKLDTRLMLALQNKQHFQNKTMQFKCNRVYRRFLCSINTLKSDSSSKGALIRLSETNAVEALAKKLGGNYAKYQFDDIVGASSSLLRQIELAQIASKINSRVLVTGESGTGKELFAQAIHNSSRRCNEPFVAISCAAIPHDLIESELFGYVPGAFTGAKRDGMIGKFELANKGTLFLDEINGMPLDMQAKLLRVLQQNEIMRLGDTRLIPIDVQIIAATNTDLLQEVEQNNFREDLYFRLSVVDIFIPPLRERMEDLSLLCNHILKKKALRMKLGMPVLSPQAMETLLAYPWPGNVRELENSLERAIILSNGGVIQPEHLPSRLLQPQPPQQRAGQNPAARVWAKAPARGVTSQSLREAIARNNGNVSRAAKDLGISRATIYRKMKKLGLADPD